MIYKSGEKEIEIFFLQEHHLALLESHKLSLSQLPYLPKFTSVTDEDALNWLAFQRAVEKQYCGFKTTTYDYASVNTIGNINRQGVVYKAKYDEVLNSDSGVNLGSHIYTHFANNKLFVLISNNTVDTTVFKSVQGDLASSLYQTLLSAFSSFELYFRENTNLKETVSQRKYIDLGFVLSKAVQ